MAETQEAQPAVEEKIAEQAPPASSRALATWEDFQKELHSREREIATLLPPNLSKEKFISSAIAAVKQNPDLLNCNKRTLFAAIIKSAQDGILPDGREGFINAYNTNVAKRGEPERYEYVASWNPMAAGLRKRARELDDILVDVQVVHVNDHFLWEQGDNPRIEHVPAKLGEERGKMIGAYAIFKKGSLILHREVMDSVAIELVREQSRAKNSLMWTKFSSEGWRKTVLRRGFKSVPVSPHLESIVKSGDEEFDFETSGRPAGDKIVPPRPPTPGSPFRRSDAPALGAMPEAEEAQVIQDGPTDQPATEKAEQPAAAQEQAQPQDGEPEVDVATPVQRAERLAPLCKTINDVADLRMDLLEESLDDDEAVIAINTICDKRSEELTKAAPHTRAGGKAAP